MKLSKEDGQMLDHAKNIVFRALVSAKNRDLSVIISVGFRSGNDLIGATEIFGKPSVLRELRKEIDVDMPPQDEVDE